MLNTKRDIEEIYQLIDIRKLIYISENSLKDPTLAIFLADMRIEAGCATAGYKWFAIGYKIGVSI